VDNFELSLSRLTLAPYIVRGMALIGVPRRSGSNMFRHQLDTMAILLDVSRGVAPAHRGPRRTVALYGDSRSAKLI
jgi:hypothetical protein